MAWRSAINKNIFHFHVIESVTYIFSLDKELERNWSLWSGLESVTWICYSYLSYFNFFLFVARWIYISFGLWFSRYMYILMYFLCCTTNRWILRRTDIHMLSTSIRFELGQLVVISHRSEQPIMHFLVSSWLRSRKIRIRFNWHRFFLMDMRV